MTRKRHSLSVIVPAYNEEEGLEPTVRGLVTALREMDDIISEFEIVVVDDHSSDRTPEIADALAKEFSQVRVFHNEVNRGIGFNYRFGIENARLDYVMMIPGDNELDPRTVRALTEQIGKADLIIPYAANPELRPAFRRFVSWTFTRVLDLISGYRLRYYNFPPVQARSRFHGIEIRSSGFTYQADIVIQMLMRGDSYYETPFYLQPSEKLKRMRVFRPMNIVRVAGELLKIAIYCRVPGMRQRRLRRTLAG